MRLPGFDYTRPFFYMVTLKRLPGLAAFSAISPEGELVENEERAKQPTNAELYARCHEMVDLVKEKLTA